MRVNIKLKIPFYTLLTSLLLAPHSLIAMLQLSTIQTLLRYTHENRHYRCNGTRSCHSKRTD